MKRLFLFVISLLFSFSTLTVNAQTQEKASKQECIAKCKEAVALFQKKGSNEAIKQLNQPDSGFTWKDSYVFVFETQKAKLLSHPSQRLVGWSMLEFRSADNILVFQEILKKLKVADQGWISYQVLINQEPPPVLKTTYYIKVPGEDLVVGAGYYEGATTSKPQRAESADSAATLKIEEFVRIKGLLHGIVFDDKGHMLIGKNGKEILKVSPDGDVSLFTEIKEADGYFIEGPGNTFLYDMAFDSQGNLYAVVEDRILKITQDGKYITLVEKKFSGFWGVCGIALDQKNNIFYAFDNKIMKLTPEGINELFLDGGQNSPILNAVVGIEFAPDYSHLFACDGKLGSGKLVKIPIRSDGSPGPVELLYHNENLNTEYIAFDRNFNLIIKGPWSESFIRVDKNGKAAPLKHADIGYGIQTIARGGQGFDQNAIYGTHMPWGVIYKIMLP
ncbi:MAG: hypothetical protein GY857_08765 [Desulfobacula sp.]|nr:hypothetical protein [Desulfobacula sp.]